MGAYLISAAIGAVIGAIYCAGAIVGLFDVRSREKAAKEQRNSETWHTLAFLVHAQNARLRVSIAAGGLTEEGKKIAAITIAALDAVTTSEAKAIVTESAKPVQEPA
jgi:hypothetical protein